MSNIDWSKMITREMKDEALLATKAIEVTAEISRRRAIADYAVAPLQDAMDIDEATEEEIGLLRAWKKYRVALSRMPEQAGYPITIDWPIAPA